MPSLPPTTPYCWRTVFEWSVAPPLDGLEGPAEQWHPAGSGQRRLHHTTGPCYWISCLKIHACGVWCRVYDQMCMWVNGCTSVCEGNGERNAGKQIADIVASIHMYIHTYRVTYSMCISVTYDSAIGRAIPPFGASFNRSLRCSTAHSVAPPPCLATPTKEARMACTQSASTIFTTEQKGRRNRLWMTTSTSRTCVKHTDALHYMHACSSQLVSCF